jgi:hypothetical protein
MERNENFMIAGEIQKILVSDEKIELVLQNGEPTEVKIALTLHCNNYNQGMANSMNETFHEYKYKKGDHIQVSFRKV